jgi:O-antigen/teichoic acid export membrane protein
VTSNQRLPDAKGDRFIHSTVALVASNFTGFALGIGFWAVAAHLYSATYVGYGVGEITAMTYVASIAILNLGSLFPRFLYAAGAMSGKVVRAGYSASILVATIGGVIFLVFTGHHQYMAAGFVPSLFFVGAAVLWVVFTIEDAALVGLRKTFLVPIENTSFSIGKIALLPVFAAAAPRSGVFASWILPVIVCVIVVNVYLFRRALPDHIKESQGRGSLPERRVLGSVVAGEYIGGLAFLSMTLLPALIVASRLGAKQAAYFQTSWISSTTFDMLLFSFATALIVESSVRPGAATATVRKAVRLAVIFLTPGLVFLVVGAPYFLKIAFGPEYAHYGAPVLRLVALALPFMAVNVLYITYARLARRVRRVLTLQVSVALIVLSLSMVLISHLGIAAIGVSFLVGEGVVALVVLPSVVRQYRHPEMSPSYARGATLVAGTSDDRPPPHTAKDPYRYNEGGAERATGWQ